MDAGALKEVVELASFPGRLRKLRKERGWSQEELGRMINVTKVSVSGYENGNRTPDTDTLQKIADVFGISVDYLLGRTDDPTHPPKDDDIGPEPHRNPLGIQLTPEQVELLREMRGDPEVLGMFRDFANSTEDERRMMLEIWETIRRRKTGGRRSD